MRNYNREALYPNTKVISSSQFLNYEKDPANFYEEWVLGVCREKSAPMTFGLVFSELYADRKFDYLKHLVEFNATSKTKIPKRLYDTIKQAVDALPVLPADQCEVELIAEYRGWKFRATLDGFVPKFFKIIENKTGKVAWTQNRLDYSDQQTFQAWAFWKIYKVQPKQIDLNWFDTGANPKQLIQSFKGKRTLAQLENFQKRIDLVVDNLEANNFTNKFYG